MTTYMYLKMSLSVTTCHYNVIYTNTLVMICSVVHAQAGLW